MGILSKHNEPLGEPPSTQGATGAAAGYQERAPLWPSHGMGGTRDPAQPQPLAQTQTDARAGTTANARSVDGAGAGNADVSGGTNAGYPLSGTGTGAAAAAGGGGLRTLEGKLERGLGRVVCSEDMKIKGLEKEQQGRAAKVQNAHLAQAERLESEAQQRRNRAGHYGALTGAGNVDPALTNTGGVRPAGEQTTNMPGTGTMGHPVGRGGVSGV